MSDTTEAPMRRVRPWLAALLTLFGWGLGFYYARRTSLAVWLAVLSVIVTLGSAAGVFVYARQTGTSPIEVFDAFRWTALDTINLALTLAIALVAWIVAARRQSVPQGRAIRVVGYFAVVLLPALAIMLLAMTIRFAWIQPFRAPSGSMQPTIHAGDYIAVTKWSYGYGRYSFAPFAGPAGPDRLYGRLPERGDLVVFRPVPEPDRDFIKRIVGLPGDRIQMIAGVLHINGEPVRRDPEGAVAITDYDGGPQSIPAFRETLPNGVSYLTLDRGEMELDNTREYRVPEGHYFLMGDDRDNSADSRVPSVVGYVPYLNLVGRVDYILHAETD